MIQRPFAASVLAASLLAGCGSWKVGAPQDELAIRTPSTWREVATGTSGTISDGWLAELNDSELEKVVGEALTNNRNLKIATARFREVRESSIITRAQRRPNLNLGGTGSYSTTSFDDRPTVRAQSYGLNLAASWEPDVWGRLRNLSNAAEADTTAALEDLRGARLSLAANTAKAWCDLISSQQQVALAEVTLRSFEANLRIIERTYLGTGDGALDIQFGRTNVSSAKRTVESQTLARDDAARALELLLGRYPAGEIQAGSELPTLDRAVPAGLPSQLLERRPDLAAERARLFASAERTNAARKQLLPSFGLTASAGTPTSAFANLLDPNLLATNIAGRFSQVLLDSGATAAQARAALERNDAQLNRYAQTALEAFREVEASLDADRSLAEQETFLAEELQQAVLAERTSERDYSEGVNPNILSVLEAQRRANNARGSMIRLRNQRLQNRIDLHLALGGDFRTLAPGGEPPPQFFKSSAARAGSSRGSAISMR